jgi:predicted nucleic acid-binding protein
MKVHVLDANALYRFLMNQPGAETVEHLFAQARDANVALQISVVNWGEVYYNIAKHKGFQYAQEFMAKVRLLPLNVLPADEALTEIAARLKAGHGLPYADGFAAAITGRENILVTADVKDFKKVGWLHILTLPAHRP